LQIVRVFEKSHGSSDVHFNTNTQDIFINVKAWVVVRKMRLLGRIPCAKEIESAGGTRCKLGKVLPGQRDEGNDLRCWVQFINRY